MFLTKKQIIFRSEIFYVVKENIELFCHLEYCYRCLAVAWNLASWLKKKGGGVDWSLSLAGLRIAETETALPKTCCTSGVYRATVTSALIQTQVSIMSRWKPWARAQCPQLCF